MILKVSKDLCSEANQNDCVRLMHHHEASQRLLVCRSDRGVLLATDCQGVLESRLHGDFNVVVQAVVKSSCRASHSLELVVRHDAEVNAERSHRVYILTSVSMQYVLSLLLLTLSFLRLGAVADSAA